MDQRYRYENQADHAMALNGNYYFTQPSWQSPTQQHYPLNPSVPRFQPTGNEVTRFQYQAPTTSTMSQEVSPSLLQMRNLMVENHFAHTKEIAGLERKTEKTSEDLNALTDIVKRDMRALQVNIEEQRDLIGMLQQQANMIGRPSLVDQITDQPPTEFLQHFSKERIAEAYNEEAQDHERAAAKLREQAEQLCGVQTTNQQQAVASRLLENSVPEVNVGTAAMYACCGEELANLQDMLKHVGAIHALEPKRGSREERRDSVIVNGAAGSVDTPTHIPPRRARLVSGNGNQEASITTPPGMDNRNPSAPRCARVVTGFEDQAAPGPVNEAHSLNSSLPTDTKNTDNQQTQNAETASSATVQPPDAVAKSVWQPLAVRQMPPPSTIANVKGNVETFAWEFLKLKLGGHQWSPGFYLTNQSQFLVSKSYWVLDGEFEPYLPSKPGEHGAKLTAFFNQTLSVPGEAPEEENYYNTPIFIRPEGSSEYVYYGNYSQIRFSDKLDYDRVLAVPEKVRQYWADQLAEQGRPAWVTEALMEHFWPKPRYDGPIPTDSAVNTPATAESAKTGQSAALEKRVTKALNEYAEELKDWHKDAKIKVNHITAVNLMAAFKKADADEEPGLRLWWEYLQFEKYDQGFYDFLIKLKQNPKFQVPMGGKMVNAPASGVETVRPAPAASDPFGSETSKTTTQKKPWDKQDKSHTGGVRPWEKKQESAKEADGPKGDMEMAKQPQNDFSKAGSKAKGGSKNGGGGGKPSTDGYVPPHLRGKK